MSLAKCFVLQPQVAERYPLAQDILSAKGATR